MSAQKPARIGAEVIEHWYSLVASENFPSKEVYELIEKEIEAQQVPGLTIARVDLSEGGPLSDKREYLRMQRERLRFDICAAPVGVNYFFSYRFYAMPAVVQPWEMVAFFVGIGVIFGGSIRLIGLFLGPLIVIAGLIFFVWLMRNAIGMGLRDIDASLLKIPVVAPIYERYFRKDTFYRQDMRVAYGSIVGSIVKDEVARLIAAKGVQLHRDFSYSPVFEGMYHARDVRAGAVAQAGAS